MKKTNKRLTRMLAVILTLTMLMSAMMVQAFAAVKPETGVEPCASGTLQGYNISATVSKTSVLTNFTCSAQSDVNMGVWVAGGKVRYENLTGDVAHIPDIRPTGEYYGYSLTIPFTVYGSIPTADTYRIFSIEANVGFGYNGSQVILDATTRYMYGD